MRRIIRLFRRRQHAPDPNAQRDAYLRAAVIDMHRRAEQMWHLTEPVTPPLPAVVQAAIPQMAREAIIRDPVALFTADDLPLMDDPNIANVGWTLDAFNALTARKRCLSQPAMMELMRLGAKPHLGRLTLTIFAPADWCEDEETIQRVEFALRAVVSGIVGAPLRLSTVPQWRASNEPGWAVSIAAMDASIPLWRNRPDGDAA